MRGAMRKINEFVMSLSATLVQLDALSYRVEVEPREDELLRLKNRLSVTLELYR
jgi:hypothetical protein